MVQIHCIAHRLNLAMTDLIKKENTLEKVKLKCDTLYHFMSSSILRVERLKEIQTVLGEPYLSVKEPHIIRWLGLKNVVDAVYAIYRLYTGNIIKFYRRLPSCKGFVLVFLRL